MPSTVIRRFDYFADRGELLVEFVTGRRYVYLDVPQDEAAAMRAAFAKGRYFNAHIRDRYRFRELREGRCKSRQRSLGGTAPARVRSLRCDNIREIIMADNDRDRDRDTVERTTIVETGGDRGSGGVLAVVLLIIVVLVLLFLFRDQLGMGGSTTEVEVPDEIQVNVN